MSNYGMPIRASLLGGSQGAHSAKASASSEGLDAKVLMAAVGEFGGGAVLDGLSPRKGPTGARAGPRCFGIVCLG